MKKVKCLRCEIEFVPTTGNKMIGLGSTQDAWMCDKCLAREAEHIDFADDRGTTSNALRIAE